MPLARFTISKRARRKHRQSGSEVRGNFDSLRIYKPQEQQWRT